LKAAQKTDGSRSETGFFSARLLEAQDNERRKLSRELHDCVGGSLVAIKMSLAKLKSELSPAEFAKVEEIEGAVDEVIGKIRTVSYLLHPMTLDVMGLKPSIVSFAEGFQRRTNITTSVEIPESLPRFRNAVEISLFRVIQESLTNAHKHANASRITILVTLDEAGIQTEIADNGTGLPDDFREGVGIRGMRERINELGGKLNIKSSKQAGTSVVVHIPLPA
jgi:signal transduction histidine kinase